MKVMKHITETEAALIAMNLNGDAHFTQVHPKKSCFCPILYTLRNAGLF